MSQIAQQNELDQLRADVDSVMRSIREFDQQIDERNTNRHLLIENLRGLLPDDQFQRFSEIINKTMETPRDVPEPAQLPPLEIDEENPLESLRKIRVQIAQEVCEVMGVEAPTA